MPGGQAWGAWLRSRDGFCAALPVLRGRREYPNERTVFAAEHAESAEKGFVHHREHREHREGQLTAKKVRAPRINFPSPASGRGQGEGKPGVFWHTQSSGSPTR